MSRRKLLAGGVVAAPTLALLHETIPHQGLHHALSGSASAQTHDEAAHAAAAKMAHGGGAEGPTFRAGESVDHAANGFNPTEILRDFDYGETRRLAQRPGAARMAAGRLRQGDRGRARAQLPGLDLQRQGSRPDPALRGRASCCESGS